MLNKMSCHRQIRCGENSSPLYGITGLTDMRFEAINIARIIKELHPGSLVMAGGRHFSKCAEDTLSNIAEIDAVCIGDGEETIVETANALENSRGFGGIPGIPYVLSQKNKSAQRFVNARLSV